MKILHLANTPLSGAPYRLMKVQQLGGMDARLISHKNTYSDASNVYFDHDILLQDRRSNEEKRKSPSFSKDQIFQLFFEADIIHCHNYIEDLYILRLFPDLKNYLKKKLVALQVHSPRASLSNINKDLKNPDVDVRFVVGQYQTRLYPECRPVPNAVDITDPLHKPIIRDNEKLHVCFSPSNTSLSGWNDKGYAETVRTMKKLQDFVDFRVHQGLPHNECLYLRQSADIAIDELITGSYHMCSLEAWSQGQPALSNFDEQTYDALHDALGEQVLDTPFMVKATPDDLEDILVYYSENRHVLEKHQRRARSFMEEFWNAENITRLYNKAYGI